MRVDHEDRALSFTHHVTAKLMCQSNVTRLICQIRGCEVVSIPQVASYVATRTLEQLPRELLKAETRSEMQKGRILFGTWVKSLA
jgi:hypothetical protein